MATILRQAIFNKNANNSKKVQKLALFCKNAQRIAKTCKTLQKTAKTCKSASWGIALRQT